MSLVSIFQLVSVVLATLVIAPLAFIFGVLGRDRLAWAQVKRWAGALNLITGVRPRGHDMERVPTTGSYIIIANHSSHLDGPALAATIPHPAYFVIKKELARIPLWGNAAVGVGFIAIDRSNTQQAREKMAEAIESIRSGKRIIVFAEGTRSPDNRLQPFKKGGFHLAVDAQVPILPIAINGSHPLYPKGGKVIRSGVVDVHACDPVPTAGLTKKDIPALVERTRSAILEKRRLDPAFVE